MKYEIPTCEIVLLDRADCITGSGNLNFEVNELGDSPTVSYPPTY